jgi:thiol-disulfide isomerase/thioredoxin
MARALLILSASFFFGTLPLAAQSAIKQTSVLKQEPSSWIQQSSQNIALSIGDKVPDIEFRMLNYSKSIAKLSDFKGKLVLLDFWATWCGPCIAAFPKLDSLQTKFGNKLQVILVNSEGTGDDETKVKQFMKKRAASDGKTFPLTVATDDKIAVQLFPHEEVPHYAWITGDGIVKAITSSKEVNAVNIQKVLNAETVKLPVKKDFLQDRISGLDGDIMIDDNLAHFSFFKKGEQKGLTSINQVRTIGKEEKAATRGIFMRNVSLLEMYRTAFGFNEKYRSFFNDPKRMIIENADPSALFFSKPGQPTEAWGTANLYSLDIVVPADQAKYLQDYILEDINRYSGYYGRVEKRKVKSLLLVKTGKNTLPEKPIVEPLNATTQGSKQTFKATPLEYLVSAINRYSVIDIPVIDQSGDSKIKIDIVVDMSERNIDAIKKALNPYGLDLVEGEKAELEMIVISKKNK